MSELLIPGRVIIPRNPWGGGHYWMNAAIVEAWGKTLLVSRVGRVPAMLAVHELDGQLQPTRTPHLFGCSSNNIVAEDPRAVYDLRSDRVHIWYVGILRDRYPSCLIFRAEMDRHYAIHSRQALHYAPLPGPFELIRAEVGGVRQEKNWMPFRGGRGGKGEREKGSGGDETISLSPSPPLPLSPSPWLCIYHHEPFTVLKIDAGGKAKRFHTGPCLRWEWGGIRGGAAPVWHDGRWWHFFHSSRFEGEPEPKYPPKVYYVGCYTFDDDLKLLGMTRQPILAGSLAHCSTPWDPQGKISACFPCGAIVRGDKFLVSYGWLDAEVRIAEVPITEIQSRLGPI